MTVEDLIRELERHPKHLSVRALISAEGGTDALLVDIDRVTFCPASVTGKTLVQLEVAWP